MGVGRRSHARGLPSLRNGPVGRDGRPETMRPASQHQSRADGMRTRAIPSASVSRHGHGLRASLAFDQLPACPSLRAEQRRADHDRGETVASRAGGTNGPNVPGAFSNDGSAGTRSAGTGKQSQAVGGRPGGYPCPNRHAFGGGTAPPAAKAVRHASVEVWSTARVPSAGLPLSPKPQAPESEAADRLRAVPGHVMRAPGA